MLARKTKNTEDIKQILKKVLGKIERQGTGKKEKILNVWQALIGREASSHSRPVSIKKGVLTIEVDSSPWLYELSLRKTALLKSIKTELAEHKIKLIRFRMGDAS
jgi:predicted nucleic acid-binding Zn ribbon protein